MISDDTDKIVVKKLVFTVNMMIRLMTWSLLSRPVRERCKLNAMKQSISPKSQMDRKGVGVLMPMVTMTSKAMALALARLYHICSTIGWVSITSFEGKEPHYRIYRTVPV
jgi:hypothetical protein